MRRRLRAQWIGAVWVCWAFSALVARAEWRLAWADEFDVDGLPDPTRWDYEVGAIRNREAQYYTRARRENARVERGELIVEARRESWQGHTWTSASLITLRRMHVRYGRIEIRAQLPKGRGVWPALWTMGVHEPPLPWPRRGEIDIMEMVGFEPDVVHMSLHTGRFNHTKGNHKTSKFRLEGASDSFHVYAAEIWPERIVFEVDRQVRFQVPRPENADVDAWPFDAPQYLLINLAIGGNWGGARGIDESMTCAQLRVDYVRVYTNSAVAGSSVWTPAPPPSRTETLATP